MTTRLLIVTHWEETKHKGTKNPTLIQYRCLCRIKPEVLVRGRSTRFGRFCQCQYEEIAPNWLNEVDPNGKGTEKQASWVRNTRFASISHVLKDFTSVGRSGEQWHYLNSSKAGFWVEILSVKSQSSFRQMFLSAGEENMFNQIVIMIIIIKRSWDLSESQRLEPSVATETNAFPFISQVRKSPS